MTEKTNQIKNFYNNVKYKIKKFNNPYVNHLSKKWMIEGMKHDYNYYFDWMGIPIIQYPNDILAIQEILWKVKPDVIIETGVAHGGSLIFYSSMLELIHKTKNKKFKVYGIEIDFKNHNKKRFYKNAFSKNVEIINSSSTDLKMVKHLKSKIKKKKTLVILDSNHEHDHVLEELKIYSNFVSKGSYCIVLDTAVEDLPNKYFQNKKWGKGNNPKTAVKSFLKENKKFKIDEIHKKLQITCAPDGYLIKV